MSATHAHPANGIAHTCHIRFDSIAISLIFFRLIRILCVSFDASSLPRPRSLRPSTSLFSALSVCECVCLIKLYRVFDSFGIAHFAQINETGIRNWPRKNCLVPFRFVGTAVAPCSHFNLFCARSFEAPG